MIERVVDVNKPVTNPELIAAIDAVRANPSSETQNAVIDNLKRAHYLSPVNITPAPEPNTDGIITLTKDTIISFLGLDSADGTFLPVFTDWDELRKWRNDSNEQTLINTYEDICTIVGDGAKYAGFSVNPYSSRNLLITQEMIRQFNAPVANSWTVKEETKIQIGVPANYPRELTDAVSKYLKTQRNVKSAHLVLMHNAGESSFLIVVDFVGDRKTTFSGIANIAVPHLKKGELIDMIPLEPGLGETVAKEHPPFYKRKAFGLF